ncbi:hypothetical protein L195_g058257, partial [Trifolium pratense]
VISRAYSNAIPSSFIENCRVYISLHLALVRFPPPNDDDAISPHCNGVIAHIRYCNITLLASSRMLPLQQRVSRQGHRNTRV